MSDTTQLEKQSLEAHVDLCALRYEQLNTRLTSLEKVVDEIKSDIAEGQQDLKSVLIKSTATIVAAILGLIVTIFIELS